jgi:hypothetical protein
MRSRLLAISVLVALSVIGIAHGTAAATNFDVTNSGMSAWVINGTNNPALTLTRGQTYTFNVTVSGHPFWITTARGAGNAEANAFPGVMGNGASPGIVIFTVPTSAPDQLFYQCGFHDPMGGTLTISGPTVPSVGPGALAVLAGLLVLAAVAILRERARA